MILLLFPACASGWQTMRACVCVCARVFQVVCLFVSLLGGNKMEK